ncbi:I10R1 protein, partial [Crypturellus undulatus]|nr:I10R1 protein [Crypturellus undulatus]
AAGEQLPGPAHVHFAAEIAHHLLRWEPGPGSPPDVRYDVEHGVYGPGFAWTAVPNCTRILGHSCDLTFYTLDPEQRYFAQVRAVSGNRTSPWKRTSSFSPREASLWIAGQSLSVTGNTIVVKLQLLLQAGNSTVRYEDIQRHTRRYRVYVRQALDNRTYEVLETQPEFNISSLFWGTEYCVSVEPSVASRRIRTTRTAEQCVTIGRQDESTELLLSIVAIIFITTLLLLLLGMLLVCVYIKKPMRPPSVLKSFLKQGSLWVEQEYSSPARPEPDPVQHLFLCQKAPRQPDTSITVLRQLPEQDCVQLPEHRAPLLGPSTASSRDCSGGSTDSGICLHNSSAELGTAGQGTGVQPPASEDSGISLERASPCLERYQVAKETRPQLAEHGGPPATTIGEDCPQEVQFRGYLQQCKGTVEPSWDRGKEPPLWGHAGPVQGTDVVLDMACAELPVSKGYMKQSPPAPPRGRTQDLAAPGPPWQPPAWDFPSGLGPPAPDVASCGGSIGGPELLKVPLELGVSGGAPLGSLPLISSLSSNTWLSLQLNPLGALQAGGKDSRL